MIKSCLCALGLIVLPLLLLQEAEARSSGHSGGGRSSHGKSHAKSPAHSAAKHTAKSPTKAAKAPAAKSASGVARPGTTASRPTNQAKSTKAGQGAKQVQGVPDSLAPTAPHPGGGSATASRTPSARTPQSRPTSPGGTSTALARPTSPGGRTPGPFNRSGTPSAPGSWSTTTPGIYGGATGGFIGAGVGTPILPGVGVGGGRIPPQVGGPSGPAPSLTFPGADLERMQMPGEIMEGGGTGG